MNFGEEEEEMEEETLEDFGYDPEEHVSYNTVNEALDALFQGSAPSYARIAPPRLVVVVREVLLIEFQLFMAYKKDGHRHPTLIINRAGVVKSHQRKGLFSAAMSDLIAYVNPHFVQIQAVLDGGGMPEWAEKNNYVEDGDSGNWLKNLM